MKIIKPGAVFELANYNSNTTQCIEFTAAREGGDGYTDGTTNEEVINMMIERFYTLDEKRHSPENKVIIILLKQIRGLLAKRLSKKINHVKHFDETT